MIDVDEALEDAGRLMLESHSDERKIPNSI